jgi:hypothetical protein
MMRIRFASFNRHEIVGFTSKGIALHLLSTDVKGCCPKLIEVSKYTIFFIGGCAWCVNGRNLHLNENRFPLEALTVDAKRISFHEMAYARHRTLAALAKQLK